MRFSYAIVALIGAAHAMPTVGSLVTDRSVCNDASADCKGVARAVVADQAALEARKKSRQAKARQANATAPAEGDDDDEEEAAGGAETETNDKRSKNLFSVKSRQANATTGAEGDDDDEEGAAGGAETETNDKRSNNLVHRAVVADKAALDARTKSRQAKARQANATAPAEGDDDDEEGAGGAETETNDKRSKNLFEASEARRIKMRDGKEEVRAVTDSAAMEDRMKSREAKSAAANGTATADEEEDDEGAEARKSRKSRGSHQLW